VSPDGQPFYVYENPTCTQSPAVTHINLIQNWFEELKAKVPGKRVSERRLSGSREAAN
jgi:hypothetical protein